MGKFYELYEDDAEIGCAALDWKMTVSGVGHCRQVGCPESGVDAAVAELVRRGYRVGRVEQMETAAEAKARTGSKTAVIRRELAGVITPVTVVDGDLAGGAGKIAPDATHVLAFVEESGEESGEESANRAAAGDATVGFAFLDAAAGRLVGSFGDDASRASLATLLSRTAPAEVVTRRGASAPPRASLWRRRPPRRGSSRSRRGRSFPRTAPPRTTRSTRSPSRGTEARREMSGRTRRTTGIRGRVGRGA